MSSERAAVDLLLARTETKRRKHADDAATAHMLSEELGRLALALEQAGAHTAQRRQGFAQHLAEWHGQRSKALTWFDARLMNHHASVAITWQTSFDQLGAPARELLRRLAWLAPCVRSVLKSPQAIFERRQFRRKSWENSPHTCWTRSTAAPLRA